MPDSNLMLLKWAIKFYRSAVALNSLTDPLEINKQQGLAKNLNEDFLCKISIQRHLDSLGTLVLKHDVRPITVWRGLVKISDKLTD